MPQCALARRTPAIVGNAGNCAGASGETVSAMSLSVRPGLLPELIGGGRRRQRRRNGRVAAAGAAEIEGWRDRLVRGRGVLRRRRLRCGRRGGERLAVGTEELDLPLAAQLLQLLDRYLLLHLPRDLRRDLLIGSG